MLLSPSHRDLQGAHLPLCCPRAQQGYSCLYSNHRETPETSFIPSSEQNPIFNLQADQETFLTMPLSALPKSNKPFMNFSKNVILEGKSLLNWHKQ